MTSKCPLDGAAAAAVARAVAAAAAISCSDRSAAGDGALARLSAETPQSTAVWGV